MLESVQTFSNRDQLIIVGRSAVHGDEEGQREVVHLLREDLAGFEAVADTLDVVVEDWVATLSHARFSDCLSVDFNCLLMQISAPVVTLV